MMQYTGDSNSVRQALLQQRIANLEQEHINWSITLELLIASEQQNTKEYENTVNTLASMDKIHTDLLALLSTTQETVDQVDATAEAAVAEPPVVDETVAPTPGV